MQQNSGSEGASSYRNSLIEQYQSFVHEVVNGLVSSLRLPVSMRDEFIAAGYLGLVEAAQRFDPSSSENFRRYAYLRVRGSIIDSIRLSSDISGKAYRYVKAMRAAQELREDSLVEEEISSPGERSEASSAQRLGKVLDYVSKSALVYRLSYDELEDRLGGSRTRDEDPESSLQKRQQRDELLAYVDRLPEKERLIIREYYFRGKPFSEIATGPPTMSKSWVSRLHSRALERLREMYSNE